MALADKTRNLEVFEERVGSYDEDELKHSVSCAVRNLPGMEEFKGWMETQGYDLLVNGFRQYLRRIATELRREVSEDEEVEVELD